MPKTRTEMNRKTHELSLEDTGPCVVRTVCGIEAQSASVVAWDEKPTCKKCLKGGRHARRKNDRA
jgi:hypothetical protein